MKRMICRILAAVFALAMLAGSASAANFNPYDAQEGKVLALQTLVNTCMWTATSDDTYNTLTRWEDDVKVYLSGAATVADIAFFEEFVMQLSFRVPLMPRIERVYDRNEANVVINYVPRADINSIIPNLSGESDVAYWHEQTDSVFQVGTIALCTEITQEGRNYGLLWSMVQLLGANNDGCDYEDSVLYPAWTEVQELSEIDWLILNMIYSPWVDAGMTADEVYDAVRDHIF